MLTVPTDAEQLARLVALKSGKAPEDVVRQAIADHAAARGILPKRARRPIDRERVKAIVERSANRPVLDPRPADEIIGYDEFRIPR